MECLDNIYILLDEVYLRPSIYTLVNIINSKRYIFIGSLVDKIDPIIKKYNKGGYKSLSKEELDILSNIYGEEILLKLNKKNSEIVPYFIEEDDSINIIKKKLMVLLDNKIHYSNYCLFAKVSNISYSLYNSYVKKIVDGETIPLGIEYYNEEGLYTLPGNPLEFKEKLPVSVSVRIVEETLLREYNEIVDKEIYFLDYSTYLELTEREEDNLYILRHYYPDFNTVVIEETFKNYKKIIEEYNGISLIKQRLLFSKYIKSKTAKLRPELLKELNEEDIIKENNIPFIENIGLNNIVIRVIPSNKKEIDIEGIFNKIELNEEIPFIKYKDQYKKEYYKINRDVVLNYNEEELMEIPENFTNIDEYYVEYIKDLYKSKLSKNDLLKWRMDIKLKNEKYYNIKDENLSINKSYISLRVKLDTINISNINYCELIIDKNGVVTIRILNNKGNIALNVIKCNHINKINSIIELLNIRLKNKIELIKTNTNLSEKKHQSNINNISYDANTYIRTQKNITLGKLKSSMSQFNKKIYYLENDDANILKIRYTNTPYNSSREIGYDYYLKLLNISSGDIDMMNDLWTKYSENILNLDIIDSKKRLQEYNDRQLVENRKIKNNTLEVDIILNYIDKNNYLLSIENCKDIRLLKTICDFIRVLFIKATILSKNVVKTKIKAVDIDVLPELKDTIEFEEDGNNIVMDDEFDEFGDFEEEEGDQEADEILEEEIEEIEEGEEGEGEIINNYRGTIRKFMNLIRVNNDPELFKYKKTMQYEQYSRLCGASDMRQPIILTQTQYNQFREKNPEAFKITNALEYGSSINNKNYYICPRIFCVKDMVALTDEQFINNDGKCPFCNNGEIKDYIITLDSSVIIRRGGANNYWYSQTEKDKSELWRKYLKKTGKTGYPSFIDPKAHPDGLCMPCCNTRPNKNYEKCLIQNIDYFVELKNPEDIEKVKIGEIIYNKREIQYIEGASYTFYYKKNIEINKGTKLIKILIGNYILKEGNVLEEIKEYTHLKIAIIEGITLLGKTKEDNYTYYKILDIEDNEENIYKTIEKIELSDTIDYINDDKKFPLKEIRYGIPIKEINEYFENDIENKINRGIMEKGNANLFLRYGVDPNETNSFLNAMKLAIGKTLSMKSMLESIIKNLYLEDFVRLNNGNLVRKFSPNMKDINMNLHKNIEKFMKWCKIEQCIGYIKDNIEFKKLKLESKSFILDNISRNLNLRRLVTIFYGYEYYKKYLCNMNLYKDYNLLWNLFTIPTYRTKNIIGESKKIKIKGQGIIQKIDSISKNIIILEYVYDENKKLILKQLCPPTKTNEDFYDKRGEVLILVKYKNYFEILKYNKNILNDVLSLFKIDILDKIKQKKVLKLLDNIKYCTSRNEKILEVDIPNIKYDNLPNINIYKEIEDLVDSQVIDMYMKGIGLLLKNGLYIETKPYSIKSILELKLKTLDNIKPISYDIALENIKMINNKLRKFINIKVEYLIIVNNRLNSFLTNYGTNIKLIEDKYDSKIHKIPVINGRLIEDYKRDEELLIPDIKDDRITIINEQKQKTENYKNLRYELSQLFKNNKNSEETKEIILDIINNDVFTLKEKREKVYEIISYLVDILYETQKRDIPKSNTKSRKTRKSCVNLSSNCEKYSNCILTKKINKAMKYGKNPNAFENVKCKLVLIESDENINKFKLYLVEEIVRDKIKRENLLNGDIENPYDIVSENEKIVVLNNESYDEYISEILSYNDKIYTFDKNDIETYNREIYLNETENKVIIEEEIENVLEEPEEDILEELERQIEEPEEDSLEELLNNTDIWKDKNKLGSNISKSGMKFESDESTYPIQIKEGKCMVHYEDVNGNPEKVDTCKLYPLKSRKITKEMNENLVGKVCATSINRDKSAKTIGFCEPNMEEYKKYSKMIDNKKPKKDIKASTSIKRVIPEKNKVKIINKRSDYYKQYWKDGKCIIPYYDSTIQEEPIYKCVNKISKKDRVEEGICATEIDLLRNIIKSGYCLDEKTKDINMDYNKFKTIVKKSEKEERPSVRLLEKTFTAAASAEEQNISEETSIQSEEIDQERYIGPIKNYIIKDTTKGEGKPNLATKGSIGIGKNIQNALDACDNYGDICKGVVKTKTGKLSLRGDEKSKIKKVNTGEKLYLKKKYEKELEK